MKINWYNIGLSALCFLFLILGMDGLNIAATREGDNVQVIHPIDQMTGNASSGPLYINTETGKVTWDTEVGDAGAYLIEITVDDGNSTDSEIVRILVHRGYPRLNRLAWFSQCWLSDNMFFDYNEDGVVNFMDYAIIANKD